MTAQDDQPLLQVQNLTQEFSTRGGGDSGHNTVAAIFEVSFELRRGETLGIVGESGAGKTTLARTLLQSPRPSSGAVYLRGENLTELRGRALIEHRRHVQLIFQDPFGSLNPKWAVCDIVEEPLIGYREGDRARRRRKVRAVLEQVGLPLERYGQRRPRDLSGGECQRVAIARALTLDPDIIICDEAVSALDALTQAQLMNLFLQLQTSLGLSFLFISHDLAIVRNVSHRVAVLHRGRLCEIGPTRTVFEEPRHSYTRMLLASLPGNAPPTSPRSSFDVVS